MAGHGFLGNAAQPNSLVWLKMVVVVDSQNVSEEFGEERLQFWLSFIEISFMWAEVASTLLEQWYDATLLETVKTALEKSRIFFSPRKILDLIYYSSYCACVPYDFVAGKNEQLITPEEKWKWYTVLCSQSSMGSTTQCGVYLDTPFQSSALPVS